MIGENTKHERKLKRLGKQLDELMAEILKEYPNAQLTSLDGGNLYVLNGHLWDECVQSLGDLDVIYEATCENIQGAAV